MNRPLRLFYLLFLLFGYTNNGFASHYMGIDMNYLCNPTGNNPCEYRIVHTTYFDCAGAAMYSYPLPGPPYYPEPLLDINGFPNTCSINVSPNWNFVNYSEVTPICPTTLTKCYDPNGSLNGVSEIRYYWDADFCSTNCNQIKLSYYNCCRNYTITSGSAGNGIFSWLVIDLTSTSCNSSPVFLNPAVPYICLNQQTTFIQGAFDLDGDSLVYLLDSCYDSSSGVPIDYDYNNGYSPLAPLGANNSISIDPTSGEITILCTTLEIGVMCLRVDEYRNGQLIGSVRRDIQVTVINCSGTNTQPTISGINNSTSNQLVLDCSNYTNQLTFSIADADPNDTLTVFWDSMVAGGVFSSSITGNTATATLDLTNVVPGIYTFKIFAFDNFCPINGRTEETYTLYFQDTTAVLISGQVTDSQNNTIPNCRVYLIKFDPVAQAIWQADMTYTDALGNYNFTSCGDSLYVKACPDSLIYPNEVPSYHASEVVFQNSNPVALNASSVTADIQTQAGVNPGGFGFIAGYLSQGANRMAAISHNRTASTPLEGIHLVLVNQNLEPVEYTTTDVNGYFAFPNLALGTYSIWVDGFRIENNLAPVVTLTSNNPIQDNLEMYLNRKWLELVTATGTSTDFLTKAKIYPNPAGSRIQLSGFSNLIRSIRFVTMDGKTACTTQPLKTDQKNDYVIDIPGSLPEGIYILEVETVEGLISGRKVVIKR